MSYGTRHSRNRGWWSYIKFIIIKYGRVREANGELERRELEAVHRAIDETLRITNGRDRLEVIDLLYWKRTKNVKGVADSMSISERTVLRWNGDFIRCVASEFFGDETIRNRKKENADVEKEQETGQ